MGSEQEGRLSPQDQLLDALETNDFQKFCNLLQNKRVKPSYRYYHAPRGDRQASASPKPKGAPRGTCLEIAARRPNGDKFIRELLSHVNPNVNDIKPEPVHHAAQRGFPKVLAALLSDKRTKANAHNSKGQTALHIACLNATAENADGYEECVKLLMRRLLPADINCTDNNGYTAIHAAAKTSRKKRNSVRHKSSSGDSTAALDAKDEHWQVYKRIVEVILDLGRHVLDLDSVRAGGRTAREDLLISFPDLQEKLQAGRVTLQADPHLPLSNALRDGRIDYFRALLQETDADGSPKLDPNHWFGPPVHSTCLEMACKTKNGNSEAFVNALLAAGADPNVANKVSEKFPIHMACENGRSKLLNVLLKYCDPNVQDKNGNTALHYVVENCSVGIHLEEEMKECFEALLSNENIDLNKKNDKELTALMLALKHNSEDMIKEIIDKRGDMVDYSLEYNNRELREALTSVLPPHLKGKLSSLASRKDEMELVHLLQTGREDDFATRLDKIQDLNPSIFNLNEKTMPMLHRAAQYGLEKAVGLMLKNGADAKQRYKETSPLVLASSHRKWGVIKVLLEHLRKNEDKEEINAVDMKGNTALHYAVKYGADLETIVLLLRHGAATNIQNKIGKTPMRKETMELLLDQCVKTNDKKPSEEEYEILFDYRLLVTRNETFAENTQMTQEEPAQLQSEDNSSQFENDQFSIDLLHTERKDEEFCMEAKNKISLSHDLMTEMDFLYKISEDKELSDLLSHPVVMSFLELKWNRLKYLPNLNLFVYAAFVMFLNVFISNSKYLAYKPAENKVGTFLYLLMSVGLLIIWSLLFLREILQFSFNKIEYFKIFENYLDIGVLLSSIFTLVISMFEPQCRYRSTVNVITIMLSSTELLVLLGRQPLFAKYIEMLRVVLRNCAIPLLSYCIIIIAFGLSFHTMFQESQEERNTTQNDTTSRENEENTEDFQNPIMSIVKSIAMMTGELDFGSYPDRSFFPIVIFVSFVLLVTVVLLNLLTGLAVSDTQKIEKDAVKFGLKTRVKLVHYAEKFLESLYRTEWGMRLLTSSGKSQLKTTLRSAILFPGPVEEGWKPGAKVKPNQSGEVVLEGPSGGKELVLERKVLESAMRIISRRSEETTAAAAPVVTLADLYAKLEDLSERSAADVETVMKMLEESRSERGYLQLENVFPSPDIVTPGPTTRQASVFFAEETED